MGLAELKCSMLRFSEDQPNGLRWLRATFLASEQPHPCTGSPRDTTHCPAGLCSLLAWSPCGFRRRRTSVGITAVLLADAESGDIKKARADLLNALAVPGVSAVLSPLRASGCLSQGSGCNRASRRGRKAGGWKGCCSLQSWLRSWPGGFLSEMLAQVAGEITQEGRGWLISRFLLGLGSSRLLAATQESVFITTALCKERSVEN